MSPTKIGRDTKANFFKLASSESIGKTRKYPQRLTGLHSYNMLEADQYKNAKLIEKKIYAYKAKKLANEQKKRSKMQSLQQNKRKGRTMELGPLRSIDRSIPTENNL